MSYRLPADAAADIETYAGEVARFQSGELAPAVFKARRVPRGVYEQRRDGTYMVRVRVAGGALAAPPANKIAALAREYGNGLVHVTTRQDLQFHDVAIEHTPVIMRELLTVGLTAKGGGGNTVRNVTACPYAGVCPAELFDVTPTVHAITEYLISLVGSFNLPRKFKIAASGCAADCARARLNDVGLVAAVRDGQPGFIIYAGGGMGAHSRIADLVVDWLPARDAVRAAEAGRRLFDRVGDRKNRERARLRFAVEKMGVIAFRDVFLTELGSDPKVSSMLSNSAGGSVPDAPVPAAVRIPTGPAAPPSEELDPATGLRVIPQHQVGLVTVPLPLGTRLGFLPAADLQALAELATAHSAERELRSTRSQGLLLRSVRREDLPAVAAGLRRLETRLLERTALHRFTSCAGASTCRLGLCLSRAAATAAAAALDAAPLDRSTVDSFHFCISGCANACGHHPVAPVGFIGAAQRADNRLVPSYRVVLGGRDEATTIRLGTEAGLLPARALPAFLVTLLRDFTAGRTGEEPFGAYYDRKGIAHFQAIVAQHSRIPPHAVAPDYYRDWGQETDFSLAGRGAGECGAGVFEVITDDLKAARQALAAAAGKTDGAVWFAVLLPTVRALLITRGIDTRDPDGLLRAFEQHFVDRGLVGAEYRALLARARGSLTGWQDALAASGAEIERLLDRVELLFSSLNANLEFHPEGSPAGSDPASSNSPATAPGPTAGTTAEMDLSGVVCPLNFVKAKLKLETLAVGDTLGLVLDEGEPIRNVPASLRESGQEILETVETRPGRWRIVVKKRR